MTPLDLMQKWIRRSLEKHGVESLSPLLGGHRIHAYHLRGTGPSHTPVVLVHGLGGSANGFSRVLLPLGKRFSDVWTLDFPGHGFSAEPTAGPLGLDGQLALLRAFLSDVVGGPAFLVGNSLGAAIALRLAHESPERVVALAAVAPAGASVPPERMAALLRDLDVRTTAEARAITRRLFHRAPLPLLLFASEVGRLYRTPTVRALVAEATERSALTPAELQSLQMPLLLLWGGSEKLLPAEGVDYFRAHLRPHAQVEVVEGFGHVPQLERPEALVLRLVEFARAHSI